MEHTSHQRDRHLDRVTRITRWTVAAAAAATGLFAFLLAQPQASAAKATSTGTADAPSTNLGSTGNTVNSSSSKSSTRLQAPAQVPRRSRSVPRASSGGS